MFIHRTKYYDKIDGEMVARGHQYTCDKCGKKISSYRPMRLTLKEYQEARQGHYGIGNYDLCNRCYQIFDRWIKKENK